MTKAIYRIVGMKHHEGAEAIVRDLKTGNPLRLVRDPKNKFDPFAVAVFAVIGADAMKTGAGTMRLLGYIKKEQVVDLSRRIDASGHMLVTDKNKVACRYINAKFAAADGPHVEVEEETNG